MRIFLYVLISKTYGNAGANEILLWWRTTSSFISSKLSMLLYPDWLNFSIASTKASLEIFSSSELSSLRLFISEKSFIIYYTKQKLSKPFLFIIK